MDVWGTLGNLCEIGDQDVSSRQSRVGTAQEVFSWATKEANEGPR